MSDAVEVSVRRPLAVFIGGIIQRERLKAGLSQGELSLKLGLGIATLGRYERGDGGMSICSVLDILWELDAPQSVCLEILSVDAQMRERAA